MPTSSFVSWNCLRRLVSSGLERYRRYLFRKKLSFHRIDLPKDEVALSYGPIIGEQLKQDADLTGGKVKLRHLHHDYPHNSERFNILYLVSSALPQYAIEIVDWAKSNGAKFVLNQNGVAYPSWTKDHKSINSELSELMGRADLVIYQSEFCREAARRFLGEPVGQWRVLPNCVDINLFQPTNENYLGGIRLLVAGTHYQKERVVLPILVLKILRERGWDASLCIAGRLAWNDAASEIESLIKTSEMDGLVRLVGSYSNASAATLYASSNILLHLKYKDPCPNVIIESLASGLPIVGSCSGGLPELVGHDGGILLDVADDWNNMHYPSVERVADAVESIYARLDIYAVAARKRALDKFNSVTWRSAHERWFASLVDVSR